MVAITIDGRAPLGWPAVGRPAVGRRPAASCVGSAASCVGSAASCDARRRAAARRRLRAARRARTVAVGALLLAGCAVWAQTGATGRTGSGPLAAPGAGPTEAIAARVWVVQPGDTLWGIAHHLQPSGDIRPLVDRLSAEVHGRPLEAGQALPIP